MAEEMTEKEGQQGQEGQEQPGTYIPADKLDEAVKARIATITKEKFEWKERYEESERQLGDLAAQVEELRANQGAAQQSASQGEPEITDYDRAVKEALRDAREAKAKVAELEASQIAASNQMYFDKAEEVFSALLPKYPDVTDAEARAFIRSTNLHWRNFDKAFKVLAIDKKPAAKLNPDAEPPDLSTEVGKKARGGTEKVITADEFERLSADEQDRLMKVEYQKLKDKENE